MSETKKSWTLADFKPGDVLVLTGRDNRGEDRRGARVTLVNYNGLGLVTYEGWRVGGLLESGHGAFKPEDVGTQRFGFTCAVEKVGTAGSAYATFYPKPGDRGYDLMC